jgi:methylmalonyl-CoA/ethylmalonyl-CoA epimerase
MHAHTLDHVGIAVHTLDGSLGHFESITGHKGYGRERVDAQGVEVIFVGEGPGRLELVAPLDPECAMARHLAARGPGMHHLCYRVDDIVAELARHRAEGRRLVDEAPRPGAHGHLVAFLHPRSTEGVLIELLQAGR